MLAPQLLLLGKILHYDRLAFLVIGGWQLIFVKCELILRAAETGTDLEPWVVMTGTNLYLGDRKQASVVLVPRTMRMSTDGDRIVMHPNLWISRTCNPGMLCVQDSPGMLCVQDSLSALCLDTLLHPRACTEDGHSCMPCHS